MSVVLATAGFDHKIRFWEAPSGVCSRIIKFPDSQVNRLEITPDKQFIAAAGNPAIRLYEILSSSATATSGGGGAGGGAPSSQEPQQAVLTLEGHTSNVTAVGFQKDGRYLYSGSEDGTVKVWDLRNPHYSRSFDSKSPVNSVSLRTDRDEFVSGDQDGCVRIWDLGTGKCIHSIKPSSSVTMNAAPPGSGRNTPLETAGADNSNPVDDGDKSHQSVGSSRRKPNHYYNEGAVPIKAVDISEDSRTLVAITNKGSVYVWDPSSGLSPTDYDDDEERAREDGGGKSSSMGVSGTGGSQHNRRQLRPITKFRATSPGFYCLHGKIAPDCRHLVTTGSDGLAKLWDTTTWELTETLLNEKWVWDAAFCADSSYLVTASSDHVARLWNLRTGDVVRKYHGHQSAVTCVALNDST